MRAGSHIGLRHEIASHVRVRSDIPDYVEGQYAVWRDRETWIERDRGAPDLDKAGVRPDAAVFVGDTVWDVQACATAHMPCIGLLSGGISRDELLAAGAAEVYEGPAELLAALPESLLAHQNAAPVRR